MWYCCEFALILQDSSEIEEESTLLTRPVWDLVRVASASTRQQTRLVTRPHRHTGTRPASDLVRVVSERSRNIAFRKQKSAGGISGWKLKKKAVFLFQKEARQGRARKELERTKRKLGERRRSEKAKVGLRISFSIAPIMISPLYLSFCCIKNMLE